MNESGLFYQMGPKRSYLGGNEVRNDVHGTEFSKHKERIRLFCAETLTDLIYSQCLTLENLLRLDAFVLDNFKSSDNAIGHSLTDGWTERDFNIGLIGGTKRSSRDPVVLGYSSWINVVDMRWKWTYMARQ